MTAEMTPNLWQLTQRGVFFAQHHSVYLSATEVNGTAIATGAYPARSFVIANTDFRPAIDAQEAIAIEDPATVARGDAINAGHYLGAPTVAELLHARGLRTAIAGSKQVALLHDRAPRADKPDASAVVFQGATLPAELAKRLASAHGAFPATAATQDTIARDAWTTQVLIGSLWKDGVPPYSLLWLAEPDASQHATGPGSAQSLAAIRSSDANLGLVLADLEKRGLLATTDVFVVSDHAFSTIARKVDVAVELSAAGFKAKRAAPGGLKPGEVLIVSNGGSTLVFVGDHDADVVDRLAAQMQTQDWAGVIFSRTAIKGTFLLAAAHIDSPDAPDLVVSLRWSEGKSANGTRGLHTSDLAASSTRLGNHASLSTYDMHNTLVAAGPDFRAGVRNPLASANTDLAPTILWLLGYRDEAGRMDGRVLSEALVAADGPPLRGVTAERLHAHRELPGGGTWSQYLQIVEINGVRYLDEGNGAFVPAAK
ncbi:MAG: alkaline phosphatase family protein [Undibacterium sp.]|nr:alkaline phosphatase family protein [Opitutaceae bacterium]